MDSLPPTNISWEIIQVEPAPLIVAEPVDRKLCPIWASLLSTFAPPRTCSLPSPNIPTPTNNGLLAPAVVVHVDPSPSTVTSPALLAPIIPPELFTTPPAVISKVPLPCKPTVRELVFHVEALPMASEPSTIASPIELASRAIQPMAVLTIPPPVTLSLPKPPLPTSRMSLTVLQTEPGPSTVTVPLDPEFAAMTPALV